MTHTHVGGWTHAWRFLLARLHFDSNAREIIRNEIGNCTECWIHVAYQALSIAEIGFVPHGEPGPAIEFSATQIRLALDAEQRDRAGHEPVIRSFDEMVDSQAHAWDRFQAAMTEAWAT